MTKTVILFLLSTFLFNLQAKEVVLATVKSDIESDIIKIVVETDEQNELTYLYSDTYKNGSLYQRKSYELSNIGDGFVIYQKSGRDVVMLNSQDFVTYAGGEITMRYLYSGLSGEYRTKHFTITPTQQSWRIANSSDRTISGFFFKAKKIFGKVVGIKDIEFKY